MPTYQYQCTECAHALEVHQSFTDDALTVCPNCQGRLRKVFNAVGVVFKGSGFYATDSRAKTTASSAAAASSASSSSDSKSESASGSTNGSTSGTKTESRNGATSSKVESKKSESKKPSGAGSVA